jgi:hypothetical protein
MHTQKEDNPSQLTFGSLFSVAIAGVVATPKANATTKRNTVFIICIIIIILYSFNIYFQLRGAKIRIQNLSEIKLWEKRKCFVNV